MTLRFFRCSGSWCCRSALKGNVLDCLSGLLEAPEAACVLKHIEQKMVNVADLPIRRHAAEIVEAVRDNDVVVVIGETGSGKTTQLSQILLEAGLDGGGVIAVTQPRRVVRRCCCCLQRVWACCCLKCMRWAPVARTHHTHTTRTTPKQ